MNKQKWIDRALELGLEGFEISQSETASRAVTWFDHSMDSFVTSKVIKTSMRASINGKIVSVSLEKVDDAQMDDILNALIEQASVVAETEKDQFVPVIETELTPSLKTWKKPSMAELKSVMASLEEKILACDERVSAVNEISWEESGMGGSLVNSLGVDVEDASQYQLMVSQATMQENGDLRDGYVIEVVNDLADFDQDAMASKLVSKISATMNAKSLSSRTCPVILEKDAMTTLFSCFASAFYGSLIEKGISPLTGKLGEKIWSDQITVIDDPRNQQALFLKNYDDEGTPTYTKTVVDHGVFEMILHNTKSALKMNAESTGNGFRSGGGATSVSAMNMYIVPGRDSLDELCEKMQNGVMITELEGMHAGVNFVSANFSLQARGFLVENGKKTRPLTLITVAGNFMDLMNRVTAVGNDLEWEHRSIACPSILFESAAIGGKE